MKKLQKALLTLVEVYSSTHVMDNTFIRFDYLVTEQLMEARGLDPVGVCLEPDYSPQSGYGLKYYNMNTDCYEWIHVSQRLAHDWLRQCGMTPDIGVLWDKDVWKQFIIDNQIEE